MYVCEIVETESDIASLATEESLHINVSDPKILISPGWKNLNLARSIYIIFQKGQGILPTHKRTFISQLPPSIEKLDIITFDNACFNELELSHLINLKELFIRGSNVYRYIVENFTKKINLDKVKFLFEQDCTGYMTVEEWNGKSWDVRCIR